MSEAVSYGYYDVILNPAIVMWPELRRPGCQGWFGHLTAPSERLDGTIKGEPSYYA